MNTPEKTELIAKFMCSKYFADNPEYISIDDNKKQFVRKESTWSKDVNIPTFEPHKSWDDLMPVVAKIYCLKIYPKYIEETSGQFKNEVELGTSITNVNDDVINFIKWYNKNKDPKP